MIVYRCVIFKEHCVVARRAHHKEDRRDPFKTMDPFPSFRPLAAHVDHAEDDVVCVELVLDNTRRGHARPQNVLQRRHVVAGRQCFNSLKVAVLREKKGLKTTNDKPLDESAYYFAESLSWNWLRCLYALYE